jgi:ornithine cyclodeaminase/alanine dehydrogenase-like protein (mu-crystallin family)
MTEKLLMLDADDVWRAMATIDAVAVLAEGLIGRTIARDGHPRSALGRLVPWTSLPVPDLHSEPVVLEHPVEMPVCVASATTLRTAQKAALAALAARELLVPGGVTVAMLGTTEQVQQQLAVISRHVPDISHVALWAGGPDGVGRLDPELVDQLDLSGIGLSVASSIPDAVFGANLVIAAGDDSNKADLESLELGHLARGTVLVNATGHDLPGTQVDEVNQVYVDDIGQLLAGGRTGHRRAGEVVRVELVGVDELNVELAYRIYRAALQRGLGVQILTNGG